MLTTRVITALAAMPLAVAAVYFGGVWFLLGVGAVALIAGWEFGRMMKVGGYQTSPVFTLGLITLLLLDGYLPSLRLLSVILTVTLLTSLSAQLFRAHTSTPTADWALTLAGGLYIGWGMAHLVALRQLVDGQSWVWVALLSTWGADTFAYFLGRTLGRHKLWPRHSPKKTWEGFGGSVLGGIFGASLVAWFGGFPWLSMLGIGVIVAVVSLFGDLSISMMKRHVGVKDSSNLFPGHGGFLDRIDSLLFVSMVVYYYAIWIG
jgi:phosphatidate cytidylyltransferase